MPLQHWVKLGDKTFWLADCPPVPLFKKDDWRVPSNLSGHTLLSLPRKVRVLKRRVYRLVQPRLQKKQCGTLDQLFVILRLCEGSGRLPNQSIWIFFRKAFSHILWDILWGVFQGMGLLFPVRAGLQKDQPLSPILFKMVMDRIVWCS